MDSLKVMILGVNQYSFTDQNTKNEVKGTTVHYVQLAPSTESDKVGYFPTKATLPYEMFEQFKNQKFPVVADASFQFDLANKRNPIKVTGFLPKEVVVVK